MPAYNKVEAREMTHLSDEELMQIVQTGDLSPVDELYRRYSPRLYTYAYRFMTNREAAEDATQETFIRMVKYARQFNPGAARLATWLFAITANICRDRLRGGKKRPTVSDEVLAFMPADPEESSPERRMEAKQFYGHIQNALDALRPDEKEVILLVKYHGFSHAEVAQVAGCSENAVKVRLCRAMKALKEKLAPTNAAGGGDQCLNATS